MRVRVWGVWSVWGVCVGERVPSAPVCDPCFVRARFRAFASAPHAFPPLLPLPLPPSLSHTRSLPRRSLSHTLSLSRLSLSLARPQVSVRAGPGGVWDGHHLSVLFEQRGLLDLQVRL